MGIFSRDDHNYELDRLDMIENQIMARGISDTNVLSAIGDIPREIFVPAESIKYAYKDGPIPIGKGQTISQPYMVALMTMCLELHENDKVLEIGTGSGYQMAVLLKITPHVYSIERLAELAQKARSNLFLLGHETVNIKISDGTCGWPEEAPFNGIIVTSGAPVVPETLKLQLAEGGRLVIPAGSRSTQTLYKLTRKGDQFNTEEITACVFVPLLGRYGWDEDI